MMDSAESLRLHLDWWGKCLTCRFWTGDRAAMKPGTCSNPASDRHQQEQWTEGWCQKWDSFDLDTALEVLKRDQLQNPRV